MVKRVSKRVSEIVFLIAAGGSTYYLIEIWFRGFSHWTMFVLGGVALTFCSFQGEVMHWSEPMWIQIIRAVLFLTSLEFMTGIICNKWLKIGIWDYRVPAVWPDLPAIYGDVFRTFMSCDRAWRSGALGRIWGGKAGVSCVVKGT